MTRAICTCFHKYQPYGAQYYEPILDFYLQTMRKYKDEYDHVYLIDSNWNIDPKKIEGLNATILKVDPNLRYYEAYKKVLPQIKENLVLFMDDDMVIYRSDVIGVTFQLLDKYGVVSIYDSCGTYYTNKLNGKNKFCLYMFTTRRELLMKYLDVDWGPHMPHSETIGLLTKKMLDDGIVPYELEEDKNSILFDGTKQGEKGKDLGYMHLRSGSVPALLLAYRENDKDQYWKYIKEQPQSEYLRQCAWYQYMGGNPEEIILDCKIDLQQWLNYRYDFKIYHNLP